MFPQFLYSSFSYWSCRMFWPAGRPDAGGTTLPISPVSSRAAAAFPPSSSVSEAIGFLEGEAKSGSHAELECNIHFRIVYFFPWPPVLKSHCIQSFPWASLVTLSSYFAVISFTLLMAFHAKARSALSPASLPLLLCDWYCDCPVLSVSLMHYLLSQQGRPVALSCHTVNVTLSFFLISCFFYGHSKFSLLFKNYWLLQVLLRYHLLFPTWHLFLLVSNFPLLFGTGFLSLLCNPGIACAHTCTHTDTHISHAHFKAVIWTVLC